MNVDSAGHELSTVLAARLRELDLRVEPPGKPDDADLWVTLPTVDGDVRVAVVVATTDGVGDHLLERPALRGRILGQRHVTRAMGERYRAAGINYVDSGGNAWITRPGFYVSVEGRKPQARAEPGVDRPSRALRLSGLKVAFVLLVKPELLDAPLRELARASKVSLGACHGAVADLRAQKYVLETSTGRNELVGQERLFRTWVSRYVTDLYPKVEEERLSGPPPSWWLSHPTDWQEWDVQLGGEAAMTALGYGLRATTTTLYGDKPWNQARKGARLVRAGEVNVKLRQRFWATDAIGSSRWVPSVLVYADALASGDSRQIEVAEQLWESDESLRRIRARN